MVATPGASVRLRWFALTGREMKGVWFRGRCPRLRWCRPSAWPGEDAICLLPLYRRCNAVEPPSVNEPSTVLERVVRGICALASPTAARFTWRTNQTSRPKASHHSRRGQSEAAPPKPGPPPDFRPGRAFQKLPFYGRYASVAARFERSHDFFHQGTPSMAFESHSAAPLGVPIADSPKLGMLFDNHRRG